MTYTGNRVSLALQGGGSHGAFTWGVLDRLLEDGRIDIGALSGASAGAMNAVITAYGMTCGGRDGARQRLNEFWEAIATGEPASAVADSLAVGTGDPALGGPSPVLRTLLFLTRFFSPYQLNPFDVNPLRDLLHKQVDFDRLRADCRIPLFIAATRVTTGTLRLFGTRDISLDVLLASACLPTLHHTIEIDAQAYWDGGLTANPPIFPLLAEGLPDDLVMVLLRPGARTEVPSKADDIALRLTEISFTSAFYAEINGVMLAKREAERGWLALGRQARKLRRLRTHVIDSPEYMSRLGALSQANAHATFIAALREEGRARAEEWLERHFDASACAPHAGWKSCWAEVLSGTSP